MIAQFNSSKELLWPFVTFTAPNDLQYRASTVIGEDQNRADIGALAKSEDWGLRTEDLQDRT